MNALIKNGIAKSFTPHFPFKRTNQSSQDRCFYEDGLSEQALYPAGAPFLGRQVIPPDNKVQNGSPSFMRPIGHYHLIQSETFVVTSGSGLWYIRGQAHRLDKGDTIVIPPRVAHTFENLPGSSEPLVIDFRYDKQYREMEERFFRNFFGYIDDCLKNDVTPSLFQLNIFLFYFCSAGDMIPAPDVFHIRCLVNTIAMLCLTFIGQVFLGYKSTYPEYYNPTKSKSR